MTMGVEGDEDPSFIIPSSARRANIGLVGVLQELLAFGG